MLVAVLPMLQGPTGLCSPSLEVRLKTVDVVGRLMCLPGHAAITQYKALFDDLLKRNIDLAVDVRVKFVSWVEACLLSAPPPFVVEALVGKLRDQLTDHEEKVRVAVIKAACSVARAKPRLIPEEDLKLYATRMQDKKVRAPRGGGGWRRRGGW